MQKNGPSTRRTPFSGLATFGAAERSRERERERKKESAG